LICDLLTTLGPPCLLLASQLRRPRAPPGPMGALESKCSEIQQRYTGGKGGKRASAFVKSSNRSNYDDASDPKLKTFEQMSNKSHTFDGHDTTSRLRKSSESGGSSFRHDAPRTGSNGSSAQASPITASHSCKVGTSTSISSRKAMSMDGDAWAKLRGPLYLGSDDEDFSREGESDSENCASKPWEAYVRVDLATLHRQRRRSDASSLSRGVSNSPLEASAHKFG
jgi:hypothetical protein